MNRLVVSGIFRSIPVRVNPRQRTLNSAFKTYLDVVHVKLGGGATLGFDRSTRPAGGDRLPDAGDDAEDDDGSGAKLFELSRRPGIYELLARSLAPSIWETDDVKKGILLQLFGGTNKSIARGGGGGGPRYRGDINVLLVGDPGTSKSQILQVATLDFIFSWMCAPTGFSYSGALVLSDGGVCCIDEFDKMSDATRSVLHEVMEQQTVSIAKAGIITTLNARTSIIAAANPVGSKYDVNLPIILDRVDEAMDRKLAQHLAGLYLEDTRIRTLKTSSGALVLSDGGVCCIDEFDKMSDATRSVLHEVMVRLFSGLPRPIVLNVLNRNNKPRCQSRCSKYDVNPPISRNIDLPPTLISRFDLLYLVLDRNVPLQPLQEFSAYIDHARSKIHPVITEAAGTELVSSYVEMRNMGDDPRASEKRITATTRQLESMIRLSEAHARMRFSEFVELQDVKEACRLMREAIRTSADSRTGKIDMGMLNTGTGQGRRKMRDDMRKEVRGLLQGAGGARGIKWSEAIKRLGDQSSVKVDVAEFSEVIKGLENEGLVKVVGERDKRTIRRIEGQRLRFPLLRSIPSVVPTAWLSDCYFTQSGASGHWLHSEGPH
ncbi:hypothetical protein D9615_005841 [Tricholomella constricta]|uniref:DNA helicase n=1 Tax=Tricholomella constricta TaxID=117010 RepID=A0A8H5HAA2_9AGAR|nr:hypothetical protein D9615_005841 [Tricholomella constricta]